MRRILGLGVSLLLAGGLVACSGNSGSPASPSSVPSGGSTTINGTAQTSATATPLFGEQRVNNNTLQVCVVGTDACVNADGAGRFELSGDFSGDIQLRFSGAGQDVVVTLHDVQPGQTITVTVALNGRTGTVDVESREGGDSVNGPKVSLCHLEGNGSYHRIEVSPSAESAHLRHGDGYPEELLPGSTILVFDADCAVLGPDVDIEKSTNGEDADRAPGPSILPTDPVVWRYVVSNTGDFALTQIIVEDSDPDVDPVCPADTLAPGTSMTCTADGFAGAGLYENLGTVVADFDIVTELVIEAGTVEDSDLSHYLGEEVLDDDEEDPKEKVSLCHLTGNGSYRSIEVSINAVPAHLAHGDVLEADLPNCAVESLN